MNGCLTCGGAIAEQGVNYGYAGKWCYCIKPPAICRPANEEIRWIGQAGRVMKQEVQVVYDHDLAIRKKDKEIEILRKYTDKYQAMFSYVPRGFQEFSEMTEEITAALSEVK